MTATAPDLATLGSLLRRYTGAGEPRSCEPVAEGLLNRGYRLATTSGRFFLKHHLDGDPAAIARQHQVTARLDALGLPVAPPVADAEGRTVAVLGDRCYALHPWIEGRHRNGAALSTAQSQRLGMLLGLVHTGLERVMDPPAGPRRAGGPTALQPHLSADPECTYYLIEELLALTRRNRPRDAFDELAEHRLLERRALLERHAHRRPAAGAASAAGWVHGDFHPLNLLYRGPEPVAIVDWDRLGVQPRAEEAVRAAAIFFVRPGGTLELAKVRAYARAYRRTAGADAAELSAAAHRVWWERLNDFWMLRWRYRLGDRRADPQFPAAAALAVWWTREYEAVREAFAG
ncbi:phosphotransferase [Streptomyces sp. H27-D2]|nr:phosphotransferase [Streptomyces sp. H27-D2]MEC4017364.1 phosphotransferase [Streptomyces sp. H27-D2]